MARLNLLQEGKSYTFRSYLEMAYEPDEILAEFGYELVRCDLSLFPTAQHLDFLESLDKRIKKNLPLVSLSSETARRETLVAPVLMEVAAFCQCSLRIEYPLMVNNWLRGNLDYLLRSQHCLLVIEAKNDDLTRGFTQLAVEMIALSEADDQDVLYGAVTIGNAWNFGRLDRQRQQIIQVISLVSIPNDLEKLVRILVSILEGR